MAELSKSFKDPELMEKVKSAPGTVRQNLKATFNSTGDENSTLSGKI